MLGVGGRFAGAKGMVEMPDLTNLTPSEATALILSSGLKAGAATSSDTSNAGLNNKVFSQTVSPGTLIDYESTVGYGYRRYVAPQVVYTLDTQKIPDGDPYPEYGCDKTPNGLSGTNPYYYCTRYVRPYKYRLLANGVWDGVSYSGYGVDYDAVWSCTFVANQCGNTPTTIVPISQTACAPNGTKSVTYVTSYKAGYPEVITVEQESCVYVPPPPAVLPVGDPYTTKSGCYAAAGCPAGDRLVKVWQKYDDGTTKEIDNYRECCPCATTCTDGAKYYFSCSGGLKHWTYITTCRDCAGTVVSETRHSGDDVCCSVSTSCGSWYSTGTWTQGRTCTVTNSDCSTYSYQETRCVQHCDIWRDASNCLGTYKIQNRKCQATDCSYYTESRQVAC